MKSFKELMETEELARSDYKLSPSGRKTHKYISMNSAVGEKEDEKEEDDKNIRSVKEETEEQAADRKMQLKKFKDLKTPGQICPNCAVDPCICDDSHGFVKEARMSVAVRMQRAIEAQRAKSDASLRRTPSSIPKKEEPKKEMAEGAICQHCLVDPCICDDSHGFVKEGSEDKIKQLKVDHATAVHWSKNEKSPQKREAARQKAEKIKAHLKKQYKIDEAAQGHTIEAHGIRGMKRTAWRKTFKNHEHLEKWADSNDSVEVHATRDLEQAKKGNLSPAMKEEVEHDIDSLIKHFGPHVAYDAASHSPAMMTRKDLSGKSHTLIKQSNGKYKAMKEEAEIDEMLSMLEEAATSIDKGEYDYEGQMARTQLQTTLRNCEDLIDMIEDDENMPEWVQSKITLAQDYITTVRDYLQSKEELGEQAPVAPSLGVHRVAVTTSEPDHPMVTNRKETTQRFVKVTTNSKERALEQGMKHFKKKGFKVHGAEHVGMMHEEVLDEGSMSKGKQKTPYVDRNSPESKVKIQAARDKMAKDKAAEPGKALLSKIKKEEFELAEVLDPSMGAGEYVKDFQKSKAPQFKNKSKEKRRMMGIAAYLQAKRSAVSEELKGNQHKLDKNKNGKLDADDFKKLRKEDHIEEEKFDPLKHVKNPTPGEKKAAKDVKRGSYADRIAMLKSAQAAGRLKEEEIEEEIGIVEAVETSKVPVGSRPKGIGWSLHRAGKQHNEPHDTYKRTTKQVSSSSPKNEEVELDEAVTSGNPGRGYHGEHDSDKAGAAYSKAHSMVKKAAGEAGHMRDVKKPNVMVKHYLDSQHGRHLKGNENAEYIKKDFGKFKKSYKPEMHEEAEMPMTYKQFMEAMWPGTAEYKKKFDTERTTGAGARHDIKDTGRGVVATRRFNDNDTAAAPTKTAEPTEKRGRGRPAGSSGTAYKARTAEVAAAAREKAAATKAANKNK